MKGFNLSSEDAKRAIKVQNTTIKHKLRSVLLINISICKDATYRRNPKFVNAQDGDLDDLYLVGVLEPKSYPHSVHPFSFIRGSSLSV